MQHLIFFFANPLQEAGSCLLGDSEKLLLFVYPVRLVGIVLATLVAVMELMSDIVVLLTVLQLLCRWNIGPFPLDVCSYGATETAGEQEDRNAFA